MNADLDDKANNGNLDTVVVLTNVSGGRLSVRLTLLDAKGTPVSLSTPLLVLAQDQTGPLSLTSLL